jgi:hypothetical protein
LKRQVKHVFSFGLGRVWVPGCYFDHTAEKTTNDFARIVCVNTAPLLWFAGLGVGVAGFLFLSSKCRF